MKISEVTVMATAVYRKLTTPPTPEIVISLGTNPLSILAITAAALLLITNVYMIVQNSPSTTLLLCDSAKGVLQKLIY